MADSANHVIKMVRRTLVLSFGMVIPFRLLLSVIFESDLVGARVSEMIKSALVVSEFLHVMKKFSFVFKLLEIKSSFKIFQNTIIICVGRQFEVDDIQLVALAARRFAV
jgi:hypothetical protein